MGNSFFRLLPEGDPASGLQPVAEVAQEDFITEDRSEIEHIFFTSDDKGTWTGVWECEAPSITLSVLLGEPQTTVYLIKKTWSIP